LNKSLWAIAGIALIGTAGGIGLLVAAAGGEEGGAVQLESTLTYMFGPSPVPDPPSPGPDEAAEYQLPVPSFTPVATCLPFSSAPGTKTWRWGDVTIVTPEGNEVHAGGHLGPEAQPVMAVFSEEDTSEQILIDAFTGQLVSAGPDDDPIFEKQAEIADALATLSVCPFDTRTALWPYTGTAPEAPRLSWGKLSFLQPDPASGLQWGFEVDDPGGKFLLLETARSEVAIDAETGALAEETARIHPDDKEALERYIATIERVSQ